MSTTRPGRVDTGQRDGAQRPVDGIVHSQPGPAGPRTAGWLRSRSRIDGETRGEWYLRQMLGSANISGSRLLHLMTGNLSHQIEHHLFPT